MIPRIINFFTDDDLYKYTMCCAVIESFPRTQVRYKFSDRDNKVYPPGFAEEVMRQVKMLETLRITDQELNFLRSRCNYIPAWFCSYLKGYRYDSSLVHVWQDTEGHLSVEFAGTWSNVILLEVKLLAIISELYYIFTGQVRGLDYDKFAVRSYEKGVKLMRAGCKFSDFGTRRRASFESQDTLVRTMADCRKNTSNVTGDFIGTSNVYFAMKYDLTPVGTMAHEFVCAIAGMYGPLMANHIAMSRWASTYRGALGTYLYDTYGWRIFSLNFSEDYANMFKGLRVDSGDNFEQLDLIAAKYKQLGIDSRTKQVIFSNALNVDKAIEIQRYAQDKCIPSFGIGTHFTNDFPGVKPLNIVIKLLEVKITESWPFFSKTCKLSEDHGKYTGEPATVKRFLETLHLKD